MNRPPLSQLTDRRAPPLHRTLPTWAREAKGDGHVQWRMYREHAAGGALYMVVDAREPMTRDQAAATLRQYRKVLFGRDKIEGQAPTPASPTPPPSVPVPEQGQATLF